MNATINQKIEFLNRPSKLKKKIERMEERAAEYDRLASSPSSPNYETPRVDGTKSKDAPFLKWIYKLMEIQEKIEDEKRKYDEVLCETVSAIEKMENEEYKSVLTYRYINNMLWEEIADALETTERTIYRWHRMALDVLEI